MVLLEMTLANDKVIKVEENDDTFINSHINSQEDLTSVFDGSAIIAVDADLMDMEFNVPAGAVESGYIRITKAKWSVNGSDFERYVCKLMNNQEIDGVFGILEHGICSGYTELIRNAEAIKVFVKHIDEIEAFISESIPDMGVGILVDNLGNFSLARLAVMAVEEKIRRKVESIIEY